MRPNERTDAAQPRPSAEPKKRFRVEKLEERIAPKGCFYNQQSKLVGGRCPRPSGEG